MVFKRFIHRASVLTGALFCVGICLTGNSCGDENRSPDWSQSQRRADGGASESKASPQPRDTSPNRDHDHSSEGLRMVVYNVENWLSEDPKAKSHSYKVTEKPEGEKQAVISILVSHQPNLIGLSEIGTAGDLADIQERLKTQGLDLPHSHFGGGSDPVRRLGLLSKYPIIETGKAKLLEFKISGKTYGMSRGILDTTIRAKGRQYRLLGVHLKSKREVRGVSQEDIRIHEARLLRSHVDAILKANPAESLIVYGDFNDTRPSKAFKATTGNYGDTRYLTAIPFKDSRGHAWTHHWEMHDIYSRIDYVLVSQAMRKQTDFKKSYVIDDQAWDKASDHRPLMAIFR